MGRGALVRREGLLGGKGGGGHGWGEGRWSEGRGGLPAPQSFNLVNHLLTHLSAQRPLLGHPADAALGRSASLAICRRAIGATARHRMVLATHGAEALLDCGLRAPLARCHQHLHVARVEGGGWRVRVRVEGGELRVEG